ncbi:MAG TPA: carboxypeptidase-like regulatory domain-containing protein, partial [Pyrinomonadaceae bacterium]|nr:carboxypeptidase-like regulatory domain-containing protein [Pyrinomonadaceae bacterium]
MRTSNQFSLDQAGNCRARIGGSRRYGSSRWALLAFALLFMACAMSPASLAQTTSSTLRGTVKDPSGAVIPNATVTLVSARTGQERKVTSSEEGAYAFASVDPGTYTLRVEGANFKTYQQTDLVISPSSTVGTDVTLEVGAASETVTVTAEAISQIQTETGEKSN